MQQKHLLALLQTGYTTIEVVFTDGHLDSLGSGRTRSKPYTYKARLEDDLKVDDVVVVDSPSKGLTTATVVDVHKAPKIDLDAPFTYKWIVQKVDRTRYDETLARESEFMDTMMEVERVHQRELLLGKFRDHMPEGSEARKMFDSATQKVIGVDVVEGAK